MFDAQPNLLVAVVSVLHGLHAYSTAGELICKPNVQSIELDTQYQDRFGYRICSRNRGDRCLKEYTASRKKKSKLNGKIKNEK